MSRVIHVVPRDLSRVIAMTRYEIDLGELYISGRIYTYIEKMYAYIFRMKIIRYSVECSSFSRWILKGFVYGNGLLILRLSVPGIPVKR